MALPHTFSDGPGNTASGVEVTANDAYLETLANGKEAAFTSRPPAIFGGGTFAGGVVAGTYILTGPHNPQAAQAVFTTGGSSSGACAFRLDPADMLAGSRQTQYRLRVSAVVNAVAPGASFTVGLYPVGSFGGASGAVPTILTIGTLVPSSTAVITTPGLGTNTTVDSAWFNAPAVFSYMFGCVSTATIAAGSDVMLFTQLLVRQI